MRLSGSEAFNCLEQSQAVMAEWLRFQGVLKTRVELEEHNMAVRTADRKAEEAAADIRFRCVAVPLLCRCCALAMPRAVFTGSVQSRSRSQRSRVQTS